ncbi:hypothetical protein CW304_06080 [Bacillus sp. UFRGS-B20]|nr:hypothetical protein CW304_06080 [Bacillus sp. UFRGS-B20]
MYQRSIIGGNELGKCSSRGITIKNCLKIHFKAVFYCYLCVLFGFFFRWVFRSLGAFSFCSSFCLFFMLVLYLKNSFEVTHFSIAPFSFRPITITILGG